MSPTIPTLKGFSCFGHLCIYDLNQSAEGFSSTSLCLNLIIIRHFLTF